MRARLVPVLVTAAVAAVIWLVFAPARFLNYDTAYALLWGSDLVHGRSPDLGVAFAPTAKPLATVVGALLSLPGLGDVPHAGFQEHAWEVLAFVALGALGWLTFALGRAWFGTAAGIVAAVLVLTREPVLSYGVRAYVDIPYVCLLLGALLVETRRRHAGAPVLVLLAVAGLLRPEAWLFTVAYLAWLWHGGALRPWHLAVAASAPVLWLVHDAALAGDPLHSFSGTRESADELRRVTGLQHVPETVPRRLGEIVREPVLVGAAGGVVLALWRLRERAVLGVAAVVLMVAAFCVLAATGLPLLTRYLLAPATLITIFGAAGVTGWTQVAREDPSRRPWIAVAVVTVVLLGVLGPRQEERLDDLRSAMVTQTHILDELRDDVGRLPDPLCRVTVPNRRAVPQLALWTGQPAGRIGSAQDLGRYDGTAFAPSSDEAARAFVLDRHDLDQTLPAPPAGPPDLVGRWWRVWIRCAG